MYEYVLLASGIVLLLLAALDPKDNVLRKEAGEMLGGLGAVCIAASLIFYLGGAIRRADMNGTATAYQRTLEQQKRQDSQYKIYIDAMNNLTDALRNSDNTVYIDKSIIGDDK